jgi:hypothetical protein
MKKELKARNDMKLEAAKHNYDVNQKDIEFK